MTEPQMSMNALAGQVLSREDHAILGARMQGAGLSEAEISNLLALVERTAMEQAMAAARNTAMAITPVLLQLIRDSHYAAGYEIWRQLCNKTVGFGGMVTHRGCAEIAQNVMNGPVRHNPVAARPTHGSVR